MKAAQTEVKNILAAKLAEVMAEVGYVQKDGTNTFHGYKYASAEAVFKKVNAALSKRGICINSSTVLERLSDDFRNAAVRITLSFTDAESGLFANVSALGQGSDKGDKAIMKATTAALKYCLSTAFLISWGDDPESDISTDKEAEKGAAAEAAPAKRPSARRKTKASDDENPLASELKEAIETASSIDNLETYRKGIVAFNGTPDYAPLVAAFKIRRGELEEAVQQGAN